MSKRPSVYTFWERFWWTVFLVLVGVALFAQVMAVIGA